MYIYSIQNSLHIMHIGARGTIINHYHQSFLSECLSADIMLSVCSFNFITFTVQDMILFYSELSFKWPYWPKNYLLTILLLYK